MERLKAKITFPQSVILALFVTVWVLILLYGEHSSGAESGIQGTILLGPQCPVVREGEECPDKPFATSLVLTTPDGSRVIKTFNSDTEGKFKVRVKAGEYAIRSSATANVLPYCSSGPITVRSKDFTEAIVSCDTGIR